MPRIFVKCACFFLIRVMISVSLPSILTVPRVSKKNTSSCRAEINTLAQDVIIMSIIDSQASTIVNRNHKDGIIVVAWHRVVNMTCVP